MNYRVIQSCSRTDTGAGYHSTHTDCNAFLLQSSSVAWSSGQCCFALNSCSSAKQGKRLAAAHSHIRKRIKVHAQNESVPSPKKAFWFSSGILWQAQLNLGLTPTTRAALLVAMTSMTSFYILFKNIIMLLRTALQFIHKHSRDIHPVIRTTAKL